MIFSSSSLRRCADVQFAQGVAFKADQFAAGLVDGVDLLLKPARAGCIPHDRYNLNDLHRRIDHRRGDHFQILLIIHIQNVSFGTVEGGRVGGLRGLLLG